MLDKCSIILRTNFRSLRFDSKCIAELRSLCVYSLVESAGKVLFLAGTLAALGQALIPYLTGQIIDFASIDPDRQKFMMTTVKLVVVSFGCAIVTGIRGGLFTVAMTRLNVRIRTSLFASLLRQEIGFYDSSRTGTSSTIQCIATALDAS